MQFRIMGQTVVQFRQLSPHPPVYVKLLKPWWAQLEIGKRHVHKPNLLELCKIDKGFESKPSSKDKIYSGQHSIRKLYWIQTKLIV